MILVRICIISIISNTTLPPRLFMPLLNLTSTRVFLTDGSNEALPSCLRDREEASEAQGHDYEQGRKSFLVRTNVGRVLRHVWGNLRWQMSRIIPSELGVLDEKTQEGYG